MEKAVQQEMVRVGLLCPECGYDWEEWMDRAALRQLAGITPSMKCPRCGEIS